MTRKRLLPIEGPSFLQGLSFISYAVGSWCPTPDGTGPATAVGISLTCRFEDDREINMVLCLKTPNAVDTMIQALLRHKRLVWPEAD